MNRRNSCSNHLLQVPDAKYAWLLEIKCLPASTIPEQIEQAFIQAETQLDQDCSDTHLVPMVMRGSSFERE